jgi:hypothetical protein
MTQADDLSRSLAAFDQNSTLIVVVKMSAANWLVAAMIPGVDRQPMKKLEPDPNALLQLLERWRAEAAKMGRTIGRVVLAYEAGRDGFWLVLNDRFGMRQSGLVIAVVERDHEFTGFDVLIVGDQDLRHETRHMRRQGRYVAADISVVSAFDKATGCPPVPAVSDAAQDNRECEAGKR